MPYRYTTAPPLTKLLDEILRRILHWNCTKSFAVTSRAGSWRLDVRGVGDRPSPAVRLPGDHHRRHDRHSHPRAAHLRLHRPERRHPEDSQQPRRLADTERLTFSLSLFLPTSFQVLLTKAVFERRPETRADDRKSTDLHGSRKTMSHLLGSSATGVKLWTTEIKSWSSSASRTWTSQKIWTARLESGMNLGVFTHFSAKQGPQKFRGLRILKRIFLVLASVASAIEGHR